MPWRRSSGLERDRSVKAYRELNRPAQLAKTADMLLEQFDRYVLIGRIKLDPIGPVARGEPELLENPTQAAEAAVEKFLKQHPRVNRYVGLLDTVQAAKEKRLTVHAAAKLGPVTISPASSAISPNCASAVARSV